MGTRTFAIFATATIAGAVCILAGCQAASTGPVSPIPLDELHERGVAGRLGPRMGTVVEVSGVVVPNTSRAKADVSEPFFLRVDTVDGRRLDAPQMFASSAMQLVRDRPALKVGDAFKCVGYERGSFQGSPGQLKDMPQVATVGFGFHVEFVVLKAG